jgi:c-di-GMP-binding flagellar brake protein YcgR
MDFIPPLGIEDLGPYQVNSRREIALLLRGIQDEKQLIRMIFKNGAESILTSVLEVDEAGNRLTLDCAPDQQQNDRIVSSDNISFETSLDRIRIMFFTTRVVHCVHDGRPALRMTLPSSMIRLQRREFYRVRTPRTPIRIPIKTDEGLVEVTAYLRDISAGGISVMDEQMVLDSTIGRIYEDCRITLSDNSVIIASIVIRNTYELKMANDRKVRVLGFQFHALPNRVNLQLQRYITKIEREQNAKSIGR